MTRKCLVAMSGGMDSTTLLAERIHLGYDCGIVTFSYGSKHNQYENRAAEKVKKHYGIKQEWYFNLAPVFQYFKSNLLQSGGPIPEGHYEAETMTQTVVPGRNMIFISILLGLAESHGYEQIALAAHSGDHAIYPDCRADFFHHQNRAVLEASDRKVTLVAPFIHGDKKSIIRLGTELNVPYEYTRTCYKDQPVSCGKCGSCQERLEAFNDCGIHDPIEYESREIFPKTGNI